MLRRNRRSGEEGQAKPKGRLSEDEAIKSSQADDSDIK